MFLIQYVFMLLSVLSNSYSFIKALLVVRINGAHALLSVRTSTTRPLTIELKALKDNGSTFVVFEITLISKLLVVLIYKAHELLFVLNLLNAAIIAFELFF